ncbi:MAG TPA: nuclear transport factor 2 family protein [Rubricoccaceae bacterium]|jgi:ketosteroid isomerase-like protein
MLSEQAVSELEERLRQAMLASDIDQLDVLIDDDLLFTTQTGAVVGKAADLDAHRSGQLRLTTLNPSDQRVLVAEGTAVVAVLMDVAGAYDGEPFAGAYRYTRVWGHTGRSWRVVAGHMSAVPPPPGAA